MSQRAAAWMMQHPNAEIRVDFRFPRSVGLIGTFEEAVAAGYVELNDDAKKLVGYVIAPFAGKTDATVFMVRGVLEALHGGRLP